MMDITLRHKLLTYLAGASIAMSSGSATGAQIGISEIPMPIMEELIDEVEDEGWRDQDLLDLAKLLAEDPRKEIRRRTAELLSGSQADLSSSEVESILLKLAQDKDPLVRSTLARGVSDWLSGLSGFERNSFVLEWSMSDSAMIRQTIAEALSFSMVDLGVDLAIEQLAGDAEATVRLAALRAAERHYAENPPLYQSVMDRLATDRARSVRRAAHRARKHSKLT